MAAGTDGAAGASLSFGDDPSPPPVNFTAVKCASSLLARRRRSLAVEKETDQKKRPKEVPWLAPARLRQPARALNPPLQKASPHACSGPPLLRLGFGFGFGFGLGLGLGLAPLLGAALAQAPRGGRPRCWGAEGEIGEIAGGRGGEWGDCCEAEGESGEMERVEEIEQIEQIELRRCGAGPKSTCTVAV